jgi:hypothetical protein
VDTSEAVALIREAVPRRAGTWADLGAGDGVFTLALAEVLGAGSRIYAVEREPLGSISDPDRAAAGAGSFLRVLHAARDGHQALGLRRRSLRGGGGPNREPLRRHRAV